MRACVLAKFLALLLFSPQWELDVPGCAPCRAALRSAVAEAEPLGERGGLELRALIRTARASGRLALCLPWLSCMLRMAREVRRDEPSSRPSDRTQPPLCVRQRPNSHTPTRPLPTASRRCIRRTHSHGSRRPTDLPSSSWPP